MPLAGCARLSSSCRSSVAAITGFGLVHLVWGAHDLDGLFARRRAAVTEVAEADV